MKLSFASTSLILFIISLAMLILLTLFESSFTGMSVTVERTVSALLLGLPSVAGIICGVISIFKQEGRRWLAVLAIVLNALFALFHLFLLAFAG